MNPDSIQTDTRAMRRVAEAVLRDTHDAEDAVQDAWVAALSSRVAPASRSWFTTVVRRLSWARRGAPVPAHLAEEPVAPATRTEACLELAGAIEALPAHYREVIEHRYWGGEPPRRIARRLGVDVKTVRNRLHRAHVQLRRSLGSDTGRASGLLIMLARPAELHAGSAATTTALVTLGKVAAAVALVVGAALSVLWSVRPGPAADVEVARAPSEGSTRALEEPVGSLGRARITGMEAEPATVKSAAGGGPVRAFAPGAPRRAETQGDAHGVRLELDVRDRHDGQPVRDFTVLARSVSDSRGARRHVSSADLAAFPFDPGAYELAVRAKGYDDVDLGRIELREPSPVTPARVLLDRGSGTLEATVVGLPEEDRPVVLVTVTGLGRWTCPSCAPADPDGDGPTRCDGCGFDGQSTSFALDGETCAFTVDRLVAGPVRIVLSRHTDGAFLASRVAAIRAGTLTTVTVSMGTKDVLVELEDALGGPFDGAWTEGGELFQAPLTFHAWSADVLSAVSTLAPSPSASRLASGLGADQVVTGRRRLTEEGALAGPRTSLEQLWPDALPLAPGVVPRVVTARRVSPGLFRLVDVPFGVNAVQVACGPFVEVPVRPLAEPGELERVHIVVDSRCGTTSPMILAVEDVTCVSCHQTLGQ